MSRWFRFYDDAINDPKVQRLSAEMFRAWVNMLCLASKYGGAIPKADIAFALRATDKGAQGIVDSLVERNLLDDMGDFVTPHNWDGRQYKSDVTDPTAADRQKRYRKSRNAYRNATVTPTVTVTATRTETETEQKIDSANAVHAEFLRACQTDKDDPILFGSQYGIQSMLARGFSRETILAGAVNGMRGKARPPNWNYFAKCIESENEQRSAPAKKEIANAKPENLVEVARRMSGQSVQLGPRPSIMGSGENGNLVRLLPPGGSE
jgi:hypothetical protein